MRQKAAQYYGGRPWVPNAPIKHLVLNYNPMQTTYQEERFEAAVKSMPVPKELLDGFWIVPNAEAGLGQMEFLRSTLDPEACAKLRFVNERDPAMQSFAVMPPLTTLASIFCITLDEFLSGGHGKFMVKVTAGLVHQASLYPRCMYILYGPATCEAAKKFGPQQLPANVLLSNVYNKLVGCLDVAANFVIGGSLYTWKNESVVALV